MDFLAFKIAKEKVKHKLFKLRSLESRKEFLLNRLKSLESEIELARNDLYKSRCSQIAEKQNLNRELELETYY